MKTEKKHKATALVFINYLDYKDQMPKVTRLSLKTIERQVEEFHAELIKQANLYAQEHWTFDTGDLISMSRQIIKNCKELLQNRLENPAAIESIKATIENHRRFITTVNNVMNFWIIRVIRIKAIDMKMNGQLVYIPEHID